MASARHKLVVAGAMVVAAVGVILIIGALTVTRWSTAQSYAEFEKKYAAASDYQALYSEARKLHVLHGAEKENGIFLLGMWAVGFGCIVACWARDHYRTANPVQSVREGTSQHPRATGAAEQGEGDVDRTE